MDGLICPQPSHPCRPIFVAEMTCPHSPAYADCCRNWPLNECCVCCCFVAVHHANEFFEWKTRRSVHWQPLRWRERKDYCVQWQRKSHCFLWSHYVQSQWVERLQLYSQSRCLRLVCDRYETYCNDSSTSVLQQSVQLLSVEHSYLDYYIFSVKNKGTLIRACIVHGSYRNNATDCPWNVCTGVGGGARSIMNNKRQKLKSRLYIYHTTASFFLFTALVLWYTDSRSYTLL